MLHDNKTDLTVLYHISTAVTNAVFLYFDLDFVIYLNCHLQYVNYFLCSLNNILVLNFVFISCKLT
jgi:hypothetical protein